MPKNDKLWQKSMITILMKNGKFLAMLYLHAKIKMAKKEKFWQKSKVIAVLLGKRAVRSLPLSKQIEKRKNC